MYADRHNGYRYNPRYTPLYNPKEIEEDKIEVSNKKYREKVETLRIQSMNSSWINSLIKRGELEKPTIYVCSFANCTNRAEQYHHIKYDSRSSLDPISIVAPLCLKCHRKIHAKLRLGVDLSGMISDRIVLEYKPTI